MAAKKIVGQLIVLAFVLFISMASLANQRKIAITVDDLPFMNDDLKITEIQEKTKALLGAMQAHPHAC